MPRLLTWSWAWLAGASFCATSSAGSGTLERAMRETADSSRTGSPIRTATRMLRPRCRRASRRAMRSSARHRLTRPGTSGASEVLIALPPLAR